MRSVKNYIETSLNESLLDDDDIFLDPENDKKVIEGWIKNNYKISEKKLTISDDFVVDYVGLVEVKNVNIESLTNGMFRWGKVGGSFYCSHCNNLMSLEGSPEMVGGDFNCAYCVKLKSLEGAPKEVGLNFWCGYCTELKSLEGAPERVGGGLYCFGCKNIRITHSDRKKYKIDK